MPFGLLVGVVIAAWCIACALTSWSRLGVVTRVPALVVSELPFALGYLLIASLVLALIQGDLDSAGGAVVAGALVVDVVGLVAIVRLGLRAHRALGNPDPPRRPWGRILRAPLPAVRRDVVAVRNLQYGEGRRRSLDVQHRRDRPSGAAVMLHFHGGGFQSGSKGREAQPLIRHLAHRGIVCVTANYRLRPHVTHEDQLADVRAAIRWVQARAADYGGDPNRLVLVGSSAGAYLAIETASQSIDGLAGIVGRYGYYGDLAPGELPPILVIHGDQDEMASVSGVRAFVERAKSGSGQPVRYAELPGAHHDFDLYESIRSAAVNVAVESFIAEVTG